MQFLIDNDEEKDGDEDDDEVLQSFFLLMPALHLHTVGILA